VTLVVSMKRALSKPRTLLVLGMVFAWNYAFSFESVKEQFPYVVTAQLLFHQGLTHFISGHSSPLITIVEIDDNAYRSPPVSMRTPTNRTYLANLIRNAAEADAVVIALDFNLASTAQRPAPGEDPEELRNDDEALFEAIQSATGRKIPVVLSTVLVSDKHGHWKRLPNIFADSRLPLCPPEGDTSPPGCVSLGHINMPIDKRQIALQMEAFDWRDQPPLKPYDSLALATVTAYETELQAPSRTRNDPVIARSMPQEFVYGRFVPDSTFLKIPAQELAENTEMAKSRCRHHIVIIGAVWHKVTGEPVENFRGPIGHAPGVYFHANYVETLLENRYQEGVPVWFALVFDALVGISLYVAYDSPKDPKHKLMVLAVFLFPLFAGYVILVNFDRYLDFVLPLGLCFVHLGSEHYFGLRRGYQHAPPGTPLQTSRE
jgi:CHASE2 domain-containing sensor protein